MQLRHKNIVVFFLVLIATVASTLLLAKQSVLIHNYFFNKLSTENDEIIPVALKVSQILTGIFFVIAGFAFVSSGFKRSIPFFPFDESIFNSTRKTIYRGILSSLFISLGLILLEDTISHLILLMLRFVHTL